MYLTPEQDVKRRLQLLSLVKKVAEKVQADELERLKTKETADQ